MNKSRLSIFFTVILAALALSLPACDQEDGLDDDADLDEQAPQISITSPTDQEEFPSSQGSGSNYIFFSASANDDIGVTEVQFYVDAAPVSSALLTLPYEMTWDYTSKGDGSYTITATARDLAGNLGTAAAVTIIIGQDPTPPAGKVYREYSRIMDQGTLKDWRVTDPDAPFEGDPGNEPATFLPNSELPLVIDYLQGATSAEAILDMWGGHPGTTNKRFRFNQHDWISIPELTTTPTDGECYTQQYNPVLAVPVADLAEGENILEGTSGGQTCYDFGWGQWGWYGIVVRVYYGEEEPHAIGEITSPQAGESFGENPSIQISVTSGDPQRVDLFAYHDAYDTDGDGVFSDYQGSYHRGSGDGEMQPSYHVGTDTTAPFAITWDTEWVPDQAAGTIKFKARIQDANGTWYETPEVANLTLNRTGSSVRLYKPVNVPESFWTRNYNIQASEFVIPTDHPLASATEARLIVRTWNGIDGGAEPEQIHYTEVNSWSTPTYGESHYYSYDELSVPTSELLSDTNTVTFYSESIHHGIEILWPGPGLAVRYDTTF